MKRKTITILLVIGILLLGGGVLLFTLNNDEQKVKQEPTTTEKEEVEKTPEVVTENNNEFVKEEHCLEKLCLGELTIKKDETTNKIVVTGQITNKGTVNIPAGYVKFLMQENDKEYYKMIQYPELQPNAKIPVNFEDENELLLYAIDYNLVEPTPTELQNVE